MSYFSSLGSAMSAISTCKSELKKVKTEDSLEEKELTKKINAAKKEIENFSLEPDESFSNDTINHSKE